MKLIKIIKSIKSPVSSTPLKIKIISLIEHLDIEGDITINLGSAAESQKLNNNFLNKDYPTDVLSFPINELLPDGQFYLGDIFICNDIAEKQAKESKISLRDEIFNLIIHGILHLLGYDHTQDNGEMLSLQSQLFDKFK
jgi:probable rRNA maturation factor